ncbi:MAG: cbb3-type cytochrome c oxidase subunit I [Dehalococcoidia bacterium]|nr:cbb3-type cytochrome c oxidase subunit I [Dehalococcoidia bacterium]
MAALTPLVRGIVLAAIGFAIGAGLSLGITAVTGEPAKEPLIVLGYVFAVIGWLMGVGMWKVWSREWFGKSTDNNPSGGWERYLRFNTDHKVIGIQYLTALAVVFLLGGLLALVIRVELADAGQNLLTKNDYNTTMSLHGIMMIAVAVAAVMGGFANFILPLIIGAEDVAFPRVNALSFWVVPPVVVLLLLTPLFGGFDTGWTAYPPLSVQAATGALLFELAFLTFGISSILGGMNFIATIVTQRAPGMTWGRLPIFAWSILAAAVISLTATQWVAFGMLMIIFERIFNMTFFSPPGGNAVLYEHVFWFYSHPAVYIMILPAFGAELEIISHFARKPVFAYRWVVRAFALIVFLSFIVWAHHLFTSGMGESLHGPFMILTELISIPTGVVFLSALGTLWRSKLRLKVPLLFALGMIFNFAIGGLTGIFLADVATDVALQDTYFVVAHFHYTIMGGEIFAIMAAGYYWFPKITGRMYNETLGRIHFVLTFVLYNITFLAMFIPGSIGMNRRVAEYPPEFESMNLIVSIAAFGLGVAFLPWVYNMLNSWIRGQKAPDNPWDAKTLEWQTSSPPPLENFETMPRVTGDPYGYGDETVVHARFPGSTATNQQPLPAEGD